MSSVAYPLLSDACQQAIEIVVIRIQSTRIVLRTRSVACAYQNFDAINGLLEWNVVIDFAGRIHA